MTAHEDLRGDVETEVGRWLVEGTVRSVHTVFEGIEKVPAAFESLWAGGSTARVIVAVASHRG